MLLLANITCVVDYLIYVFYMFCCMMNSGIVFIEKKRDVWMVQDLWFFLENCRNKCLEQRRAGQRGSAGPSWAGRPQNKMSVLSAWKDSVLVRPWCTCPVRTGSILAVWFHGYRTMPIAPVAEWGLSPSKNLFCTICKNGNYNLDKAFPVIVIELVWAISLYLIYHIFVFLWLKWKSCQVVFDSPIMVNT